MSTSLHHLRRVLVCCWLAACSDTETAPRASDAHKLSTRGLYDDLTKRRIVQGALEYAPEFPLWSDGADKRRWLILPPDTRIDTSEMAHWDFPVGTKLFKEFSRDGVLLETRLIERIKATGRTKEDFFMGSFIWLADQSEALLDVNGRDNVNGTQHDVPAQKFCSVCHVGEPSAVLGFSAVQLAREDMRSRINDRNVLSSEIERSYAIPGDRLQRAALGTLHANCGHCHAQGAHDDFMHLRVLPGEADSAVEELEAYQSTVGVELSDEWRERPPQFTARIVPGDPDMSAIVYRMTQRGDDEIVQDQMPPIASRKVDWAGVDAVRAWARSLLPHVSMAAGAGAAGTGGAPPTVEAGPAELMAGSHAQMPADAGQKPAVEMPREHEAGDADGGAAGQEPTNNELDSDAGTAPAGVEQDAGP